MASTETKFQVVGRNLITLSNLLLGNQNICKLLYYTSKTPLSEPTITDTDFLMNKNIRLVPKVPDEKTEKGSFIIILLDNYMTPLIISYENRFTSKIAAKPTGVPQNRRNYDGWTCIIAY